MKKLIFAYFIIACVFSSCDKENTTPSDCTSLVNTIMISEEEKATECIFFNVYDYNGETYTIRQCCTCFEAYMAYDCEGNALCNIANTCMNDFDEEAEYLYAVKPQ